MIRQVSSQLADFLRFGSTPATCDEFRLMAVNRNVGGLNPPGEPTPFYIRELSAR